MAEPLTPSGPWKWSCPTCDASGVVQSKPAVVEGSTLNCTACVLAGRGLVLVRWEEVPRGPAN